MLIYELKFVFAIVTVKIQFNVGYETDKTHVSFPDYPCNVHAIKKREPGSDFASDLPSTQESVSLVEKRNVVEAIGCQGRGADRQFDRKYLLRPIFRWSQRVPHCSVQIRRRKTEEFSKDDKQSHRLTS